MGAKGWNTLCTLALGSTGKKAAYHLIAISGFFLGAPFSLQTMRFGLRIRIMSFRVMNFS